jgi:pilus assembly protein CpaB
VTLLVYPEQSERLALASTEGKIQLALRNPLDQGAPETPGMKQGVLLGAVKAAPARQVASNTTKGKAAPGKPVTQEAPAAAPLPTVEIIRGDKRSAEVIK